MFIVEGPDGSGKSTFAKELSEKSGLEIHSWDGPPKTKKEFEIRLNTSKYLFDKLIIQDRSPWISEPIYGFLERNEQPWLSWSDSLQILSQSRVTVIYCRPPNFVILNNCHNDLKIYDTPKRIEWITKYLDALITLYDRYMKTLKPYATYDWTLDWNKITFGAFAEQCKRRIM